MSDWEEKAYSTYINCVGIALNEAILNIASMVGDNRLLIILKKVDRLCRERWDACIVCVQHIDNLFFLNLTIIVILNNFDVNIVVFLYNIHFLCLLSLILMVA